jgi:hypothetical protein
MKSPLKAQYRIVSFEHIDDHRCFRPLADAVGEGIFEGNSDKDTREQEEQLRSELAELFRDGGWEGDGEIECFFVPPCFCNRRDTHCETIFHVKQSNNGTSWLAIPRGFRSEMSEQFC